MIEKLPRQLSTVELLLRIEDDKHVEKHEEYKAEIINRKLTKEDIDKALKEIEMVKSMRQKRAEQPLTLGEKILAILLVADYGNIREDDLDTRIKDDFEYRGQTRKMEQYRNYRSIGIAIYFFILVLALIVMLVK